MVLGITDESRTGPTPSRVVRIQGELFRVTAVFVSFASSFLEPLRELDVLLGRLEKTNFSHRSYKGVIFEAEWKTAESHF
jgi:hypothetical protein